MTRTRHLRGKHFVSFLKLYTGMERISVTVFAGVVIPVPSYQSLRTNCTKDPPRVKSEPQFQVHTSGNPTRSAHSGWQGGPARRCRPASELPGWLGRTCQQPSVSPVLAQASGLGQRLGQTSPPSIRKDSPVLPHWQ
eukprot:66652-Rhodomonas_salina.1